jgi:peptide/nickel transport system permease protein
MTRYLVGRVAQALVVLWAAYTLTFAVLFLLPSDPVALQLNAAGIETDSLTPGQLHEAMAKYGLDHSIVSQYLTHLFGALHGDFGVSISKQVPVSQLIGDRIGGTIALSGLAVLISLLAGTALAYLAAFVRIRPLRLLQVVAFSLGWLPSSGDQGWRTLVLPVVTMAIPTSAVLAQVLMRSFDETLRQPYITTARAKGLSRAAVQRRHAFRNAALPTLTILGLLVGATVTGAIVVETVFTRNGLGKLAQESVLAQDIPVVLAIVVLAAAAFVLVNLVVDLLYPLLDPRIVRASKVKVSSR